MPETLEVLQLALTGRYRVERELGRGGMATVFLAEDLKHDRRVAIKVLEPEVASVIGSDRFLREIKTAAQLSHPHILPLFDSGEGAGLLYYVMPYVGGGSLRQRLVREPQLPVAEAQRIAEQVADALDYAHAHGVVHRDIKPENILLEGTQAIVADFGIARAVVGADAGRLTTVGITVGTPAYMSPEQATGDAVDGRSDVYSLGCVVYELLTGEPPYTGPTGASLIRQHLSAPVPDVGRLRPGVGAGTSAALKRALAKSPEERYATAGALVRALAAGAAHPVTPVASTSAVTADVPVVGSSTAPKAGWLAGRRTRWVLGAVTVAVLALAAVAVWQEWRPLSGSTAPPAKKDWILVAEFEGPPGDSTLAPAARSLLSAALDQSRIVATVPREQIAEALQSAGQPPSARLVPELAKELAYRSAVRAVLEGTIGKLGSGYSIVVRLVDADTVRVLFTESATAQGDDALIPALGELAKKLRRGLGENRHELRATRPMTLAATPSFQAYRFYVEALRKRDVLDFIDAVSLQRQALALDPEFAMAWGELSTTYAWRFSFDSVRVCLNEALRNPQRLTIQQRRIFEVRLAFNEGDTRRALEATEQLEKQDPSNISVLHGSQQLLREGCGRSAQALDWERRAMALSPFGPTEEMRIEQFWNLVALGRIDEARELQRQLKGTWKTWLQLWVELVAGNFAIAESVATVHLDDPALARELPSGYRIITFAAQAGRGTVKTAAATLEQATAMDMFANSDFAFAEQLDRAPIENSLVLIRLWTLDRGASPLPPETWMRGTSAATILVRGLRAAFTGNRAGAQGMLDAARARPERELKMCGAVRDLLEARIAMLAGRPEEAIRLLRPIAVRGLEPYPASVSTGLAWIRWALADALEQTGRPDSAAFYLERSLSPPGWDAWEMPYIRQRLVVLVARQGRIVEAEHHLAMVGKAWDRPDPAIRGLLEEARAAVRNARQVAIGVQRRGHPASHPLANTNDRDGPGRAARHPASGLSAHHRVALAGVGPQKLTCRPIRPAMGGW